MIFSVTENVYLFVFDVSGSFISSRCICAEKCKRKRERENVERKLEKLTKSNMAICENTLTHSLTKVETSSFPNAEDIKL